MLLKIIATISSLAILLFLPNFYSNAQCTDDAHSTNIADAWVSCQLTTNPNPIRGNKHWIRYDLGYIYTLKTTNFWNYNVENETGKGFKEVIIDYSIDGNNWLEAAQFQLPKAPGTTNYLGFNGPDLGRHRSEAYILLTAQSTWDEGSCAGLAEFKAAIGASPLPLELLTFTATPLQNHITLKWESIEATNLSHFIVERSTDAHSYTKIDQLLGKNMPPTNKYSIDDHTVKSGQLYYYRLKIIRLDGNFDYSPIRIAQINETIEMTIFPNPTNNILNIKMNKGDIKEVIIQNTAGREVMRKNTFTNSEWIDVSTLAAGLYFVRVINRNNTFYSQQFVKIE